MNKFVITSSLPPTVSSINNSEELSYFPAIDGEVSYLAYSLVCRNDGTVVLISQNIVRNLYFNSFRNKISPVFNKALKNMMNIRNHLLLQLDLECGNISEEYFDNEEAKYLTESENISLEKLKEEIEILYNFTDLPLNPEEISEILNCSVDDAENALKNYLMGSYYASAKIR